MVHEVRIRRADPARQRADEELTRSGDRIVAAPRLDRPVAQHGSTPAGTIDPAMDPDDVFDMLLGAVLTRTLLSTVTARDRAVECTVEMILRIPRPLDGPV
jgi:hypothetical protein